MGAGILGLEALDDAVEVAEDFAIAQSLFQVIHPGHNVDRLGFRFRKGGQTVQDAARGVAGDALIKPNVVAGELLDGVPLAEGVPNKDSHGPGSLAPSGGAGFKGEELSPLVVGGLALSLAPDFLVAVGGEPCVEAASFKGGEALIVLLDTRSRHCSRNRCQLQALWPLE